MAQNVDKLSARKRDRGFVHYPQKLPKKLPTKTGSSNHCRTSNCPVGTEKTNALTMLLDTIDLLAELASQCASHTHPGTGAPVQSGAFTQTATKAGTTKGKYAAIIA
jgi:hypothetical protein